MLEADYEVRTSARRTRTMTAFREAGRIVVVVPENMSVRQQRASIPRLVEAFLVKEARQGPPRADADLTRRAVELFETYVAPYADGSTPRLGVRWVGNMAHRWGSCTASTGEIRLSDRLQDLPIWVVDYALLHEVTHLVEREHSARFWEIVNSYGKARRARGFLEGVEHAQRQAR